jgi:hypothetical protein
MTLSQPLLTKPVLQLLQNQLASLILSAIPAAKDKSLTEQYLLSRLGLKLTMDAELSPDLQRFQQHFVLYHLLYRLQTEWLTTGEGFLSICLAKVTLLTTYSPASHELAEQNDNSSRREYYTNWQNFYAMSEQLLDDYLQQFWQRYSKVEVNTALLSAEQAQQCLQLNPDFTLTELKKAYRRKALLLHPDRTSGDVEKFRQVQQAYQQLLKACQ